MLADEINSSFHNMGYNKREGKSETLLGRKVMGRKGIGKLAAFSLANVAKVLSIKNGVKAGCVLDFDKITMTDEDPEEVSEDRINFANNRISEKRSGTRLELIDVKKRLNINYRFIVSKLIRMFDVNDSNFDIHIRKNTEPFKELHRKELDYFSIMDTIVTIGNEFDCKRDLVKNNSISETYKRAFTYNEFLEKRPNSNLKPMPYKLKAYNKNNNEVTIDFNISGWIGTIDSLPHLKVLEQKIVGKEEKDDEEKITMNDNRISIYARGKLGEYNILPKIKSNSNAEAYIIGELFVDIFEEDNLSDMAISNRRGYEESDNRYTVVIKIAKNFLGYYRSEEYCAKDCKRRSR